MNERYQIPMMARGKKPAATEARSSTGIRRGTVTPPYSQSDVTMGEEHSDEAYESGDIAESSSFEAPSGDDPHQQQVNILGATLRRQVDALNKLADLNLQVPPTLPKIVVVGDQSAGKSSLIEAISGIRVPRASGVCTRCPLQINLKASDKNNDNWHCSVDLVSEYFYDTTGEYEEPSSSLGPWHQLGRTIEPVHFADVEKPRDVEDIIMRAQRALLNPGNNPLDFLKRKNAKTDRDQAKFSPNYIRLTIYAAKMPNLSLFDLPGIINQSEFREEPYLPELIRKVNVSFISKPHTIVVWACPMTSDPATSTAGSLITQLKVEHRTLGVFTKPDRLDESDNHSQWLKMLQGKAFKLGHGYFVTRLQGSSELDKAWDNARRDEAQYFAHSKIWTASELSKFKSRFGTLNLTSSLSKLLADEIRECLPKVKEQVILQTTRVEAELNLLPQPADDNSLVIVINLVNEFQTEIAKYLDGDQVKFNDLHYAWSSHCEKLLQDFRAIRPVVNCNIQGDEDVKAWRDRSASTDPPIPSTEPRPTVDLDKMDTVPSTPSQSNKRSFNGSSQEESPAKRPRARAAAATAADTDQNSKPLSEYGRTFALRELAQMIKELSTSGVPSSTDPRADDFLIHESMQHLSVPVEIFLKQMREALRGITLNVLRKVLEKWSSTAINNEAQVVVEQCLYTVFADYISLAETIVDAERSCKPFTKNTTFLSSERALELQRIKAHRNKFRTHAYVKCQLAKANREFDEADIQRRMLKVTDEQLGPDNYSAEIETMARVKGYYTVATSSIVDTLAKLMQLRVFARCRRELSEALYTEFKLNERDGFDNAKRLLAEDPEREQQRIDLTREKKKLDEALRVLEEVRSL